MISSRIFHLTLFLNLENGPDDLYNFKSSFFTRNRTNHGEVSMDSDSLAKTLKSMLNTLPRTLAPLIAINCFLKKNHKIVL